jgi:Domain of unknown function (DUF4266)
MKSRWLVALSVLSALCSGCASNVQAWQKGEFAKESMSLKANALEQRFASHSYDSREASHGGGAVGGGGCGCN